MFSGAVKIGDLNDFIAPSQACVVNLEGGKLATTDDAEAGWVQLQQRAPKGFSQTLPATPDQPVKVSLHDCLACSGCVTSAETVLLQHQSTAELLQRLADGTWTVVVSLSPQSVAALAALHGLSAADCAARLATFLRRLGARAVFNISAARRLALAEAAAEFVQRYRASARGAAALAAAGVMAAAAASSDAMNIDSGPVAALDDGSSSSSSSSSGQPIPMLASACPGWVCYAEKTHGDHVLPYIATGKSPQAVMGTLVKRRWCGSVGLEPAQVYHCAVMPCYDKKLEASREDFWLPGTQVPETDSVLATTELQELLEQHQVDLHSLEPSAFDPILPAAANGSTGSGQAASSSGLQVADSRCRQADGSSGNGSAAPVVLSSSSSEAGIMPASSGSGGYLEYVFRAAAAQLFGRQLPAGPLQMRVGRNADLREVTLEVHGIPVLRFAAAYGFRNIQGLMRKVKLRRCEYDYVEVMACPSGCLNGGGQPKPAAVQTTAQLLERLETRYVADIGNDSPTAVGHAGSSSGRGCACVSIGSTAAVQSLYADWVGGPPGSEAARHLLHTQYHKREKTVTATLADW